MHENPYEAAQLPPVTDAKVLESSEPRAGFPVRLVANLIDILPLSFAIAAVYYVLLGFGDTLSRYFEARDDIEARFAFLRQRNQIQNLTFLIYIVYSSLMESSSWQATLGKKLLGLRVTDLYGNRLSIGQAFGRNLSKIISSLPCALGYLWAIWSPTKQAWHDSIAKALVIKRR